MRRTPLVTLAIGSVISLISCSGDPGRCLGPNLVRPAAVSPRASGLVLPFKDARFLNGRWYWVYLPPGYGRTCHRYPVLYMNDGHFISRRTGSPESWGVDSVCDAMILAKEIEPIIVVGITSSDSSRFYDYPPFLGGDRYLRAIRDTLKPTIDRKFATLPDANHTSIMGASLGGLISVYAGYAYDGTFGRVAGISGSYSWDRGRFFDFVSRRGRPAISRLYLDSGTVFDNLGPAREMRDIALSQGFVLGADLFYLEADGAAHEQRYFAARVPGILRFLIDRPSGRD